MPIWLTSFELLSIMKNSGKGRANERIFQTINDFLLTGELQQYEYTRVSQKLSALKISLDKSSDQF